MHEQAIRVPLSKIRLLGQLPLDVQVVRTLSPWEDRTDWLNLPAPVDLYLRIRHRICWAAPVGGWLTVEDIEDFISRYATHCILGEETFE